MNKLPIIFLMGNTGVGKTKLSIKLILKKYPVEIISVDSSSIYREMNIGTAKPSEYILKKFPHKLINIRDPSQRYSVYNFYNDSINLIKNIHLNKNIPVFCGGSFFYFNTLLKGLTEIEKNDFYIIKNFIEKKIKKNNIYVIFNKIRSIFPNLFINTDINNRYKISKIINMYIYKGFINYNINNLNKYYKIYQYCIIHDNIYDANKIIKYRFNKMLSLGFEEEVYKLYLRKDLNINNQSINSIGYKQMWLYFKNKIKYKDMINMSILSTYNLIKNQNKWIKNWKNILIINKSSYKIFLNEISNIINKLNY